MQKTKVLGSLKGIFPPIQQTVLTKRESERLLNALKASFRAQLDKEHGVMSLPHAGPLNLPKPTITYLPSTTPSETSTQAPLTRPTDRHMQAVLSHPLFSLTETAKPAAALSTGTGWDAHKTVFEKAVSRGLMTTARANGFLVAVQAEVSDSVSASVFEGVKSTGAGRLVLQWLRSSGQESDLSFMDDFAFTRRLSYFLVAEGLEDVLWVWVERAMKKEQVAGNVENPLECRSSRLLSAIVSAKCAPVELEAAFASVLRGRDMVTENSLDPKTLVHAWRRLAWQATVDSYKHTSPPVPLFDSFVNLGQSLPVTKLVKAHINVHHPTNPSVDLAIQFLSKPYNWEAVNNTKTPRFVRAITSLSVDTVQLLMQADRMQEATRILTYCKDHLRWGNATPVGHGLAT